jgi:hypothetical protein
MLNRRTDDGERRAENDGDGDGVGDGDADSPTQGQFDARTSSSDDWYSHNWHLVHTSVNDRPTRPLPLAKIPETRHC